MNVLGGGLFYSVEKELPSLGFRSFLLSSSPQGYELDLLPPKLDLELIAGLQAQLGGVGLADHQVAVELDLGRIAEAAARPALAATAANAEVHALGLQQGLIESGEIQAFAAVLFGADIAGGTNQLGFREPLKNPLKSVKFSN